MGMKIRNNYGRPINEVPTVCRFNAAGVDQPAHATSVKF